MDNMEENMTSDDLIKKKNKNLTLRMKGGQQPNGTVKVSGAKNSALKLMAACLLTSEKIHLDNFPTRLVDIVNKSQFLEKIGVVVSFDHEKECVTLNAEHVRETPLKNYDYLFRTTYLLAAGQLARNKIARIPYPGGCKIGERKYDLHIHIWEQMGCMVKEKADHIEIRCKRLKPCEIRFPISTVGGTENALLMAAVTDGLTTIRNAYVTPEINDLVKLLSAMGASIRVYGNSLIEVVGTTNLRGASIQVMSDRIEALSWIIYASLSEGRIVIENTPFDQMEVPLIHLREAGIDLFRNSCHSFIDYSYLTNKRIQPFEVACGTYPGVISDMQPFFVLLGLRAIGTSRIYDYRYPERIAYLEQLSKICKNSMNWVPGEITIDGPSTFIGAEVVSTDLRGSMALIFAGLLAENETVVHKAQFAMRGYNNLLEKFQNVGIKIELI